MYRLRRLLHPLHSTLASGRFVAVVLFLVGGNVNQAWAETFQTGDRVTLETLGTVPGARWLDGRTANGSVGLAPTFGAPFTGSIWEITRLGDNVYALKCLGAIEGNRWLDGHTGDATVGLAPTTGGTFTGTRWEFLEVDRGVFTLRTLGTIDGSRWLDGRTQNATVGLALHTGGVFTGTRWRIHRYLPSDILTQHNDNGRTGASLTETVLDPALVRSGRFGKLFQRDIEGGVFGQPLYTDGLAVAGKGVHNVVFVATTLNYVYAFDADDPAQGVPLWRSAQLGTPVHRANLTAWTLIDPAFGVTSTPVIDRASSTMYVVAKSKTMATVTTLRDLRNGNRILLECLGQAPGSRWLNARTAEESVDLAANPAFSFTGTVWDVQLGANDSVTLRNLGHLLAPGVQRYLDGRTQDGSVGLADQTTGGFTGTHWQVVDAGNGTFNLKNLGAIRTPHIWLDGRTANATVGLADTTGGVFTGTRWRIHRLDFHNRLYAIDIATGQINGSVEIEGRAAGFTFDSTWHLNRPALLLLNNVIYVAFGAHADTPPWQGWIFGYEAGSLRPAGVFVGTTAPHWGAGLWQAGNGLVGDAGGSIYFATGNGDPDGPQPPADVRNSFVRLRPDAGALRFAGAAPPAHRRDMDFCDLDLGSAGPVQLPGTRRLVGGGKEGVLHLLDMDSMQEVQHFQAAFRQYPPDPDKRPCPNTWDFEVMMFYPHVHGSPVVWPVGPPNVSLLYLWAEQDFLRSFVYDSTRGRIDVSAVSAIKAPAHSMPGGVLSLSANGGAPGTGIVWATRPIDCTDHDSVRDMANRSCNGQYKTVPGIVHAFDAITLDELWNSERKASDRLGFLAKYSPPTIAHGKLYVATSADSSQCSDSACPNHLLVYGVLWGQ